MNADGSGWRRLTERNANDYYPAFSPDGARVVFVSNQTGFFDIYLRYLALSDEQQVSDGFGSLSSPGYLARWEKCGLRSEVYWR